MASEGSIPPVLNCKISSNVDDLEVLRTVHSWLPGRETVRPTPELRAVKEASLAEVHNTFCSMRDYILQSVFGYAPERDPETGKLFVAPERWRTQQKHIFDRNLFSYNVPQGTRHYIMWYAPDHPSDDAEITRDITEALRIRTHTENGFEFAWYENPKMTIPDVYHVQVFWHRR